MRCNYQCSNNYFSFIKYFNKPTLLALPNNQPMHSPLGEMLQSFYHSADQRKQSPDIQIRVPVQSGNRLRFLFPLCCQPLLRLVRMQHVRARTYLYTCIAYGIHVVYIGLHFVVDNDTPRIEIDIDQLQFIFHYFRLSTNTTE